MAEWLVSGAVHFVLGFIVGWIVLERPQWATDFWLWLCAKIGWV